MDLEIKLLVPVFLLDCVTKLLHVGLSLAFLDSVSIFTHFSRFYLFILTTKDLVIKNYLKLEAHVLGFQYKFVDVGIDIQARNFRQSLATPLENTKTTFTAPDCPPELPVNCGFGKCAANAIECGLIRVSAGLEELDYMVGQFAECTRVLGGLFFFFLYLDILCGIYTLQEFLKPIVSEFWMMQILTGSQNT